MALLALSSPDAEAQLTVEVDHWYSCGTEEYFVSAQIAGGTPPYNYYWSTGHGSYAFGNTIWDIPSPEISQGGEYYLLVRDQNLDHVLEIVSVGLPYTIVQPTCTDAIGEIHLDVSELTGPLTVEWFGPGGFYAPSDLASIVDIGPGTYSVKIIDANGCQRFQRFDLNPTDLVVEIDAIYPSGFIYENDPPAPGEPTCTGGVDITISGGVQPYDVLWQPTQQTSEDLTEVNSDIFQLRVEDAVGCRIIHRGIHVPSDWVLTLTAEITPTPSCGAGGAIDLTVTGGNPPYTYQWGFGQTTEDVIGLYAGLHTVVVTDAHGCTRIGQFYVDGTPKSVNLEGDVQHSCPGGANGSIDVTLLSGVPPFSFSWSGPNGFQSAQQNVSGLMPGIYSVIVVDAIGCAAIETFRVEGVPDFTLETTVTPSCTNMGAIDLTVTGGVPPFMFAWNTGANAEDISGLSPGMYHVSMVAANGCTASTWVNVPTPEPYFMKTLISGSCSGGSSGSIDLDVIGGVAPFTLSWYGPGGFTSSDEDLADLAPGTYGLAAQDAVGCWAWGTYEVPVSYTITLSATPTPTCSNTGSIDLEVDGGQGPYSFTWYGPGGYTAATEDIDNLPAGSYAVTVTDAAGCQATGTWTVVPLPLPSASAVNILPSCMASGTGLINLAAGSGTPPYTFDWSGPGGFSATTLNPGINGLFPGEYTMTMTDAMGCTFVQTYFVPAHPDVAVDAIVTPSCTEYGSGTIAAIIAGGAPPYSFNWSGPDNFFSTQASISGLVAGTYDLAVFDANGCSFYFSYEVPGASCCPADLVLPPGSSSLSLPDVVGGTVYIAGPFYVQDELIVQNATVYMGPGAEIFVSNGAMLEFDGSSVTSCDGIMWKGITANNGTTVRARNSFLDDAERLITAHDGSNLWLRNNQFHNNRVSVLVPPQVGGTYSNVTIMAAYNTFYSQGPMPQPYPGQQSVLGDQGYAAFELNRTGLSLTAGWNLFHHLSNGIVAFRTDLTIYDATFEDIAPDAAYTALGNANGSGIYANGVKSWATLELVGHGNGELSMPSFNNCRWGVYTETMNVKTWGNRMVQMGTAYRIDRSGYRHVDVFNNRVQCKRDGMDLRFNNGAAHILLDANHITFGDQPGAVRGFCGIRVEEAATANLSSVIQNNTILHAPYSAATFGISLRAANDWKVQGNQVMMASRLHSRTGILLNGCNRTTVNCNSVDSSDPLFDLYPIDGQAGIRNWMGSQPLISCNNVDKTTNGILFSGWASDTDLRGNEIHNHRWGLHLEGDAIIGEQHFKGNIWHAPAPGNGYEAIYQNAGNADLFQFWVNASVTPPNGGSYMPGSIWPLQGWFENMPGDNYSCEEEFACDGLGERCKGCSPELIERIADGILENEDYTPETRWTMKGDLYKLLTEEPERMDGNPLLEDFYTDVEAEVLAQLKQLEADQLALYDLDPSVSAALVQGAAQLEALRGQLKDEVAALADENLTSAQQQAHVQTIEGLQAAMDNLMAYHGNALELAATSRALTADGVKATNSAIATGELIEANHKAVNEVYLSTMAKEITAFTTDQAADLFAVANQCPLTGGNAVFRARALYGLIDDEQQYDDAELCLQQGLITKRKPVDPLPACLLLPNPAKDQASLVLDAPLRQPATLLLVNAQGAHVLSVRVPAEQLRVELNLAGLAPGIYHYTLRGPQGTIGSGKLAVER